MNNFEALPNSLNTFLCFMVGRDAVFVETLPEECLIDVVHELFSKCFPALKLPRPVRVLLYVLKLKFSSIKLYVIKYFYISIFFKRSRWYSDEYAKGSYTFIKTGSSVNDVKALAHPLVSVIV